MLTSKWNTLNRNCQKFNAIFKRCKRVKKSGKNDLDVMKRARKTYRDENKGKSFTQEGARDILKTHCNWDAPSPDITRSEQDHTPGGGHEELFDEDSRPRPPGKARPAKKTNPRPRHAPRKFVRGSEEVNGDVTLKWKVNEDVLRDKISLRAFGTMAVKPGAILPAHALCEQEARGSGSAPKRTRTYIPCEREEAEQRLIDDYFSDDETLPKYPEENFRRRYRMSSILFNKIVNDILSYDAQPLPEYFNFFRQRYDACVRLSIDPILKCTSAIRQLAYDTDPDAFNEYLQIDERCSRQCLENFTKCIHVLYVEKLLRKSTSADTEKTYKLHEEKLGLSGMLGKAVADKKLWIWQAYFEVLGANNDLNVLYGSLFDDELADRAPECLFVVNRHTYKKCYYLADGIYPALATFVKMFSIAMDEKTLKFNRVQESSRKDIERAFGVLQDQGYEVNIRDMFVSPEPNIQRTWVERYDLHVRKTKEIRDRKVHNDLRHGLVEHLWNNH
ncbi:RNA-directed DNA polymerase, eukaryota [Tanacetum coccineum]